MSQHGLSFTNWLWCLLMVSNPINTLTQKVPPKEPGIIEAQAKFFQDFFSVQLSPYKIEFGHVCEDPNTWEQRYEKKDFKNHRDMGKVRWGDKQGGYGEHYWDLNHAGHADNHNDNDEYTRDSEDDSYRVHDDDPYDEPSEPVSSYNNEYDAEKSAQSEFEENNRAKRRAYPRIKSDRKAEQELEDVKTLHTKPKENKSTGRDQRPRRFKARQQKPKEETYDENPQTHQTNYQPKEQDYEEDVQSTINTDILKSTQNRYPKINHQQPQEQNYDADAESFNRDANGQSASNLQPEPRLSDTEYVQSTPTPHHYVPYEAGAGVRQYVAPASTAASIPRLFLEPSTGRVVDRATGQAYILQPIAANYYN